MFTILYACVYIKIVRSTEMGQLPPISHIVITKPAQHRDLTNAIINLLERHVHQMQKPICSGTRPKEEQIYVDNNLLKPQFWLNDSQLDDKLKEMRKRAC